MQRQPKDVAELFTFAGASGQLYESIEFLSYYRMRNRLVDLLWANAGP